MYPFDTIETPRLILRKFTPEVYYALLDKYQDEELIEVFGLKTKTEVEDSRKQYAQGLSTYRTTFAWFQVLYKADMKFIGWCGYHTWYLLHNRAEIGYGITEESYKQKGLMSEAVEAMIKFGFEEMKLHRIEACVGPTNIPSLKLMQKFKFIKEGYLKEHYLKNGIYEDSVVFSLLRPTDSL